MKKYSLSVAVLALTSIASFQTHAADMCADFIRGPGLVQSSQQDVIFPPSFLKILAKYRPNVYFREQSS